MRGRRAIYSQLNFGYCIPRQLGGGTPGLATAKNITPPPNGAARHTAFYPPPPITCVAPHRRTHHPHQRAKCWLGGGNIRQGAYSIGKILPHHPNTTSRPASLSPPTQYLHRGKITKQIPPPDFAPHLITGVYSTYSAVNIKQRGRLVTADSF